MTTDLYLLIHQAQRYHLYRLGERIGRCDGTDPIEAEAVAAELRDLVDRLADHAHSEETYIHPLFRRLGWDLAPIEREHHELDAELAQLSAIVNQRRWPELYPAFNRFTASYLRHTAAEEQAQRDVLWARCDESELAAVLKRFKSERPPERARTDLGFMPPALSVTQAATLLRGMRAVVPAEVFAGARAQAERALGVERWRLVEAAI